MKKPIRAALGAATLVATIAGASAVADVGLSAAAASKKPPVTITYWGWGGATKLWQQVQQNLDKVTGQKITINYRSILPTSYDSVLTTAMNAGTGPDVFKDRTGTMMQQFATAKLIDPLGANVNLSNFGAGPISTVTFQGQVYGVPQVTEQMVAFYNKSIFAKLHLAVPHTWKAFISALSRIKAHNITPIYMMGTQQWLIALDFEEVAASILGNNVASEIVARKINFTSPQYVSALRDFQELGRYLEPNFQAVGAAGNEQEVAFAEGHAAVILDGLFDVSTIEQAKPNFKIGEFLVPPQKSSQQPVLDWYPNASYSVNSHIQNPQVKSASLALLKYLSSPSFGQLMVNDSQETDAMNNIKIPSNQPLLRDAYYLYQHKALHPLIGIDSPMDFPPVNTKDIGVFQAEQNVLVQLLQGKMTAVNAAQIIQNDTKWYFHGGPTK